MGIELGRVIECAKAVASALESLLSSSDRISMVYDAQTRGLARVARIALKLSNPKRSIELVDAYSYPAMELPYVSEEAGSVIAFLRVFSALHRVATSARLLSVRAVAISTRLPNELRRALREFRVVELDSDVYSLATLLGVLEIASRSSEARASRIGRELELTPQLLEEVGSRFSILRRSLGEATFLCSIATEPLCDEVKSMGFNAIQMHDAEGVGCLDRALLVYTSCEDQVVAEFVMRYRRKCPSARIESVRVNTDPLTASLYLLLAFKGVEAKESKAYSPSLTTDC